MVLSDNQKIGVLLTGLGSFFTFLGVMLLFDRGLLSIGNMLFLSGITLILGLRRTSRLLIRRDRAAGTATFFGGIFLVLIGWPFIGMLVQGFGFINLFANFFPVAVTFARRLPVIGHILELPGISWVAEKIEGGVGLPV